MDLYRYTRQAAFGATQMAIAGLEQRCGTWPARRWACPCGGSSAARTGAAARIHCATYRVENWELFGVKTARTMGTRRRRSSAVGRGYTAFKTNIIWPGEPARHQSGQGGAARSAGYARDHRTGPPLRSRSVRETVGPNVDICLDVNVNFKPSPSAWATPWAVPSVLAGDRQPGRPGRAPGRDPHADLRRRAAAHRAPVRSVLRGPGPRRRDGGRAWQGSRRPRRWPTWPRPTGSTWRPTTTTATPSTFQSLNLCAAVSNVKIMESDPDAVPLRDELFTRLPEVKDGHIAVPTAPGWGTELNRRRRVSTPGLARRRIREQEAECRPVRDPGESVKASQVGRRHRQGGR